MSIKRRESGPLPAKPLGCVVTSSDDVRVVRFVLADRTVSYPAGTITRWELSLEAGETLTVDAGGDRVTATGSGLSTVRDALDGGHLKELRTLERARAGDEPWVEDITIERR